MDFTVYDNDGQNVNKRNFKFSRKNKFLLAVVSLFLLFIFTGQFVISLVSEYIWIDSIGFSTVFLTILSARVQLFLIGFLLFSGTLLLTLLGIRRTFLRHYQPEELAFFLRHRKFFLLSSIGISFFYGLMGSGIVQGLGWERWLTYRHQVPFQVSDPIFHHDVSFYIYSLPFFNMVISTLLSLLTVILVIQGSVYGFSRLFWSDGRARMQLMAGVLLYGILLGARHYLERYDTLLTNTVNLFQQKSVVYGLSYTDAVLNVPMALVLAILAPLAALAVVIGLVKRRWAFVLAGPVIYIAVIGVSQIGASAVQQFLVTPTEFQREQPYLAHNLAYTRQAYDLDRIRQEEHPGLATLSEEIVEENRLTLDNVRINDYRPLLSVYNQLQTIRTYYQFNDVDVDRYRINGEYQQVFIGSRELNTSNLPDTAQRWESQTLRYTHGYGVAASHVNAITPQGQPEYIVGNLPPEGELKVTRPQIYFGEQDNSSVIVNTEVDEFDYPEGQSYATYRYTADTGIPMTRLNRLVYALEEGSPRIFISGMITKESQLLRKRNIMERLQSIAPFLKYDDDPYIVVREDGTLVWIVDAYTTSRNYPYAEPVDAGFNYIRNPVKAVVDAYTGEVNFYVVDPEDPMWQTYERIFPDLFTMDIPEDIRAHFRYPVNLFTYQADIYRAYQMNELEVFYNREDMWAFPTERYYDQDIFMEPYYITMQLPGEEQEEFILMQPFTPNNRQNMIAWLAARNDGEHYGELLLYRFPKQQTVYGPQQIENRINQDPYISQQLNLWSQGGSRVIRGNLLVIPIGETLLYVEPIYIESDSQSALPEVGKIVVAYDNHIVMEDTFEEAIQRLLEMEGGEGSPSEGVTPDSGVRSPLLTAEGLVDELTDLFNDYREAMSAGEWAEAGRVMQAIEQRLEEWERRHNNHDPNETDRDEPGIEHQETEPGIELED